MEGNELILDSIVNYMITGIKKRFELEGLTLTSKTVEAGKIKLKFERLGFKLTTEFGKMDIAALIYENFIDEDEREQFTLKEFNAYWQDYIDTCNAIDETSVNRAVSDICDKIVSSKLPFNKKK